MLTVIGSLLIVCLNQVWHVRHSCSCETISGIVFIRKPVLINMLYKNDNNIYSGEIVEFSKSINMELKLENLINDDHSLSEAPMTRQIH